jgi:hypothetical protein
MCPNHKLISREIAEGKHCSKRYRHKTSRETDEGRFGKYPVTVVPPVEVLAEFTFGIVWRRPRT